MGAISSLASALGLSGDSKPVKAGLAEVDPLTGQQKTSSLIGFQYFPETIMDSKSPTYSSKHVPGGSHPIRQFIDGGDRTVSFTVIFTHDKSPVNPSIFSGGLSTDFLFERDRKDTIPIPQAIAWLRSYTYPEIKKDGVSKAPPICVVYLPNSGIISGVTGFKNSITAVMTQCDVTYQSFHRDGTPRIVAVSLAFAEVIQIGSNWKFIGRIDVFPPAPTPGVTTSFLSPKKSGQQEFLGNSNEKVVG